MGCHYYDNRYHHHITTTTIITIIFFIGKNKKELQSKEETEMNTVRVIRSELDSTASHIKTLEDELTNLGNERGSIISKIQKEDESKKPSSSSSSSKDKKKSSSSISTTTSVKSSIKVKREKLASLISKIQKEKNDNTKHELRLEADVLRAEITKEGTIIIIITITIIIITIIITIIIIIIITVIIVFYHNIIIIIITIIITIRGK
jgi:DNA repair exonuclease SbcCD ATPase subunit